MSMIPIIRSSRLQKPRRLRLDRLEGRTLLSVRAVAAGPADGLFITGDFTGAYALAAASGPVVLTAAGAADAFLARYDAAGQLVWAESLAGSAGGTGAVTGAAADAAGNLLVTGTFTGSVDFDPGPGTASLVSAGSADIFVASYTPDGALNWAARAGGTGADEGRGIAADAAGNVYVTGLFSGKVDFDPGPATGLLASRGGADAFLWRLSASGNFGWAQRAGGTSSDGGNAVAVGPDGSVLVAGWVRGTATAGSIAFKASGGGGDDAFLAQFDAAGTAVWAGAFGAAGVDRATGVAVDAAGNGYVAGTFKKTVDFDPGAGRYNLTSRGDADLFLSKFDPVGTFAWARGFGGTGVEAGGRVAVSPAGGAVVAGSFEKTARFSAAGSADLASQGAADALAFRVTADGALGWQQAAGGAGSDAAADLVVGQSGAVRAAGPFGAGIGRDNFLWTIDPAGQAVGAHGLGSPLPPLPTGSSDLDPSVPPSGNFDLTRWKLTLPTGGSDPVELLPAQLVGYASEYFYTAADGAMTFWAPVTGAHTDNSSYPRSELREMTADGKLAAWKILAGPSTLPAELAVRQVPSSGRVIVGQIHSGGDPVAKLEFDGKLGLVLRYRLKAGGSETAVVVAPGVKLGDRFAYTLGTAADGTLTLTVNGAVAFAARLDPSWNTKGLFFKAGAYTQDNSGPSTEGARVAFYALSVSHG